MTDQVIVLLIEGKTRLPDNSPTWRASHDKHTHTQTLKPLSSGVLCLQLTSEDNVKHMHGTCLYLLTKATTPPSLAKLALPHLKTLLSKATVSSLSKTQPPCYTHRLIPQRDLQVECVHQKPSHVSQTRASCLIAVTHAHHQACMLKWEMQC